MNDVNKAVCHFTWIEMKIKFRNKDIIQVDIEHYSGEERWPLIVN